MRRAAQVRQAGQVAKPAATSRTLSFRTAGMIAASLAIVTLIVYLPVRHFDFLNYDDPEYLTHNPHVRSGLTGANVLWAFTTYYAGNWHPLTWVSHMADWQLYGGESGSQHLVNVLLHSFSALLLFAILYRLTHLPWRSGLVAFLFALHPLHVESVAWLSERKDVLCGFFWFLAIWSYVRFVERRTVVRYLPLMALFAFSLMAKSMAIALPFVLLLLDFWPLKRTCRTSWRPLTIEKVPLIAMSCTASLITFLAQRQAGAVSTLTSTPIAERFANAAISYVTYLLKILWPTDLAVIYPLPGHVSLTAGLAASVTLLCLSTVVVRAGRRYPYILTGWLWYLGTLVPVIGIVQVGAQSHADRYTYLPAIGIFVILVWGVADLVVKHAWLRKPAAAAAVLAMLACVAVTSQQLSYWRDSATLFRHALQVNSDNYLAHDGLGNALSSQGEIPGAIGEFETALRLRPAYEPTHVFLSKALLSNNRTAEAAQQAQAAIALTPNDADAHISLGAAEMRAGRFQDAEAAYRQAISLHTESPIAHSGLGMALSELGRTADGIRELRQAVAIDPEYIDGHYNLGRALGLANRTAEAIAEFAITAKLDPRSPEAHFNLATALANAQQFDESIREFQVAIQVRPEYVNARLNLGRVFLATGRARDAASEFKEVLRLDPDSQEARMGLAESGEE